MTQKAFQDCYQDDLHDGRSRGHTIARAYDAGCAGAVAPADKNRLALIQINVNASAIC
jgi:hypothetical protein